ncbi:nucleotidyltransferase domain-containing protein [Dyadobacter luticola]|uniref:Nucleotidyltransferase n=1 Tax=Dyadobacter luticola TaxID=1979387 RepID=A0A5R9KVW2_9BACT|nr:nucleotidyltransferase domain-containing protein [Dyadobacter luticola]TLV00403.1 nucleotidyltransferase [Dyadobacter luticola]
MEIYAFGSLTRGEVDKYSDYDFLILRESHEKIGDLNKDDFSIYTYKRIDNLWKEGNPFAWHLFKESKCIFTSLDSPYIPSLKMPKNYMKCESDLERFYQLYLDAKNSLLASNISTDFDLSMIFLAIRNFASCFALGILGECVFSRNSARMIGKYSLDIVNDAYGILIKARVLATRGIGATATEEEVSVILKSLSQIDIWFNSLIKESNG